MEKYKIIARARWAFDIFHIFMKKNRRSGSTERFTKWRYIHKRSRSIKEAINGDIFAIAIGLEPC